MPIITAEKRTVKPENPHEDIAFIPFLTPVALLETGRLFKIVTPRADS
jgi:hypothetical protein